MKSDSKKENIPKKRSYELKEQMTEQDKRDEGNSEDSSHSSKIIVNDFFNINEMCADYFLEKAEENENMSRCKVVVRIKPSEETIKEKKKDCEKKKEGTFSVPRTEKKGNEMITYDSNNIFIKEKKYVFDKVFSENANQEEIYNYFGNEYLGYFFEGYNCTFVTHGQKNSGKSYTIGLNLVNEFNEETGIIPRFLKDMYNIMEKKKEVVYDVTCTYIGICNGKIVDFFSNIYNPDKNESTSCMKKKEEIWKIMKNEEILIREDIKTGEIFLVGVNNVKIKNMNEFFTILKKGTSCRASSAENTANTYASHTIFTIALTQKKAFITESSNNNLESVSLQFTDEEHTNKQKVFYEQEVLYSKFQFVDLAGTDKYKVEGNDKKATSASIHIKKELFSLHNVIHNLSKRRRGMTEETNLFPYRNSKLTKILQDAIGGNSKTVMISCLDLNPQYYKESKFFIKYAKKMKCIRNKPKINYGLNYELIKELRKQLFQVNMKLREYKKECTKENCKNEYTIQYKEICKENEFLKKFIKKLKRKFIELMCLVIYYKKWYEIKQNDIKKKNNAVFNEESENNNATFYQTQPLSQSNVECSRDLFKKELEIDKEKDTRSNNNNNYYNITDARNAECISIDDKSHFFNNTNNQNFWKTEKTFDKKEKRKMMNHELHNNNSFGCYLRPKESKEKGKDMEIAVGTRVFENKIVCQDNRENVIPDDTSDEKNWRNVTKNFLSKSLSLLSATLRNKNAYSVTNTKNMENGIRNNTDTIFFNIDDKTINKNHMCSMSVPKEFPIGKIKEKNIKDEVEQFSQNENICDRNAQNKFIPNYLNMQKASQNGEYKEDCDLKQINDVEMDSIWENSFATVKKMYEEKKEYGIKFITDTNDEDDNEKNNNNDISSDFDEIEKKYLFSNFDDEKTELNDIIYNYYMNKYTQDEIVRLKKKINRLNERLFHFKRQLYLFNKHVDTYQNFIDKYIVNQGENVKDINNLCNCNRKAKNWKKYKKINASLSKNAHKIKVNDLKNMQYIKSGWYSDKDINKEIKKRIKSNNVKNGWYSDTEIMRRKHVFVFDLLKYNSKSIKIYFIGDMLRDVKKGKYFFQLHEYDTFVLKLFEHMKNMKKKKAIINDTYLFSLLCSLVKYEDRNICRMYENKQMTNIDSDISYLDSNNSLSENDMQYEIISNTTPNKRDHRKCKMANKNKKVGRKGANSYIRKDESFKVPVNKKVGIDKNNRVSKIREKKKKGGLIQTQIHCNIHRCEETSKENEKIQNQKTQMKEKKIVLEKKNEINDTELKKYKEIIKNYEQQIKNLKVEKSKAENIYAKHLNCLKEKQEKLESLIKRKDDLISKLRKSEKELTDKIDKKNEIGKKTHAKTWEKSQELLEEKEHFKKINEIFPKEKIDSKRKLEKRHDSVGADKNIFINKNKKIASCENLGVTNKNCTSISELYIGIRDDEEKNMEPFLIKQNEKISKKEDTISLKIKRKYGGINDETENSQNGLIETKEQLFSNLYNAENNEGNDNKNGNITDDDHEKPDKNNGKNAKKEKKKINENKTKNNDISTKEETAMHCRIFETPSDFNLHSYEIEKTDINIINDTVTGGNLVSSEACFFGNVDRKRKRELKEKSVNETCTKISRIDEKDGEWVKVDMIRNEKMNIRTNKYNNVQNTIAFKSYFIKKCHKDRIAGLCIRDLRNEKINFLSSSMNNIKLWNENDVVWNYEHNSKKKNEIVVPITSLLLSFQKNCLFSGVNGNVLLFDMRTKPKYVQSFYYSSNNRSSLLVSLLNHQSDYTPFYFKEKNGTAFNSEEKDNVKCMHYEKKSETDRPLIKEEHITSDEYFSTASDNFESSNYVGSSIGNKVLTERFTDNNFVKNIQNNNKNDEYESSYCICACGSEPFIKVYDIRKCDEKVCIAKIPGKPFAEYVINVPEKNESNVFLDYGNLVRNVIFAYKDNTLNIWKYRRWFPFNPYIYSQFTSIVSYNLNDLISVRKRHTVGSKYNQECYSSSVTYDTLLVSTCNDKSLRLGVYANDDLTFRSFHHLRMQSTSHKANITSACRYKKDKLITTDEEGYIYMWQCSFQNESNETKIGSLEYQKLFPQISIEEMGIPLRHSTVEITKVVSQDSSFITGSANGSIKLFSELPVCYF